jgi:hypothetical protein
MLFARWSGQRESSESRGSAACHAQRFRHSSTKERCRSGRRSRNSKRRRRGWARRPLKPGPRPKPGVRQPAEPWAELQPLRLGLVGSQPCGWLSAEVEPRLSSYACSQSACRLFSLKASCLRRDSVERCSAWKMHAQSDGSGERRVRANAIFETGWLRFRRLRSHRGTCGLRR